MKKIVLTVAIIILLICLVPFRQQFKDGGSVCYNAILYDVYDVHSLYEGPGGEMKFVEGKIIKVFGIQLFNNTNPHIENFGDSPDIEN